MTSPHPTFHPFLCKREGGKKEQVSSPSPAPRQRGFPLPLWRGVNGLANRYWMLENRYWVLENRARRPRALKK